MLALTRFAFAERIAPPEGDEVARSLVRGNAPSLRLHAGGGTHGAHSLRQRALAAAQGRAVSLRGECQCQKQWVYNKEPAENGGKEFI